MTPRCPRCYRTVRPRANLLCGVCRTSANNKVKREAQKSLGTYLAEQVWGLLQRAKQ
jgi:hypothetical protein